jgi:aspartyl-tRNA(Asn)/glutamyl-tRNA(Gln) amidotransferase subunit B
VEIVAGRTVEKQTLAWNDVAGELRLLRMKEHGGEYRFMREPDLPPLVLDGAFIEAMAATIAELPLARAARLESQYALRPPDADVLCASRPLADYFETVVRLTKDPHAAAAWTMREVLSATNALQSEFLVSAEKLAELILLVKGGNVSSAAARTVFRHMWDTGASASDVAQREGLWSIGADADADTWVSEVVAAYPRELERLRNGEVRIFDFLVGELMKKSKGRLDPSVARELVARATQTA